MYKGSMYGAGPEVFAVWPYVIANANMEGVVELNPQEMANALGMTQNAVLEVISRFIQPDDKSRSKVKEGRKLERLGEYSYSIVNYAYYRAIRKEEDRREQNRMAAAVYRQRQKEIEDMTPEQLAEYDAAKAKEYSKRVKPRIREMRRNGKLNGAGKAIREGFERIAENGEGI